MKTSTSIGTRTASPSAADAMALPAIRWRPATTTEILMPYEAAAKAIFVRANGLLAYYKTTGTVGRTE